MKCITNESCSIINKQINIPIRQEWNNNQIESRCEISIFTDVSVTDKSIGVRIYLEIGNVKDSPRIHKDCSILPVEMKIERAARLPQLSHEAICEVRIYFNRQANGVLKQIYWLPHPIFRPS